jgi:acyl-coenzyme A synthetase/AMP-(fatty) acid ligase
MFDLFMAWSSGGCLVPVDAVQLLSPLRVVNEHSITVWFSAPAVVALLRYRDGLPPGSLPSLRWSLFCGEPLPVASAQAWQRAAPQSIVENLYGPTEATIACLVHRWDPATSPDLAVNRIVPIGTPYPGMKAQLFNAAGAPAETGGAGELCVAGPQLFGGYWHDSRRSAEALFSAPGSSGTPVTWYRTGDLAVRLANGEYAFLGRRDSQVKVRGHRIELGEVQAALEEQEGVVQAVAFTRPGRVTDTSDLVAVVTGSGLNADALLDGVRRMLPSIMVPRELYVLGELPLTINGKVDRDALRARFGSGEALRCPR